MTEVWAPQRAANRLVNYAIYTRPDNGLRQAAEALIEWYDSNKVGAKNVGLFENLRTALEEK